MYDLFYNLHPPLTISTWSLPYKMVNKVNTQILPSLPNSERKDIEGIARCMRGYIQEDLKHIKEDYLW